MVLQRQAFSLVWITWPSHGQLAQVHYLTCYLTNLFILILRPYSYASIFYFIYYGKTTGLAVFIPTESPEAGKLQT